MARSIKQDEDLIKIKDEFKYTKGCLRKLNETLEDLEECLKYTWLQDVLQEIEDHWEKEDNLAELLELLNKIDTQRLSKKNKEYLEKAIQLVDIGF